MVLARRGAYGGVLRWCVTRWCSPSRASADGKAVSKGGVGVGVLCARVRGVIALRCSPSRKEEVGRGTACAARCAWARGNVGCGSAARKC